MKYKIDIDILGDCKISVWDGDEKKSVEFTAKKSWLLFEYLFLNSSRCLGLEEIKGTLWGEQEIVNLGNSVKVLIYDVRKRFDTAVPGLGKQIIRNKLGTYYLCDTDLLFDCDADRFEEKAILALESRNITDIRNARGLYSGSVQITEEKSVWQQMLREKYHSYYRRLVLSEIDLLIGAGNREEALKTCADANLYFPKETVFVDKYQELAGG